MAYERDPIEKSSRIMRFLKEKGIPCTQADIVKGTKLDKTAVSRIVNKHEELNDIRQIEEGKYVLFDFKPLELKIEEAITKWRIILQRNPDKWRVAKECEIDEDNKDFKEAFPKVAKKFGWDKPTYSEKYDGFEKMCKIIEIAREYYLGLDEDGKEIENDIKSVSLNFCGREKTYKITEDSRLVAKFLLDNMVNLVAHPDEHNIFLSVYDELRPHNPYLNVKFGETFLC